MTKKRRLKKEFKWGLALVASLLVVCIAFCIFGSNDDSVDKGEVVDGIDVSHYQDKINWEKVRDKHPNIQFVYIKAIEGSSRPDENYRRNFEEAKKAGFMVGSYIFYHTMTSPERHFEEFKKLAPKSEQDLIPVVDVETLDHKSPELVRKRLIRLLDLMEQYYGKKPIIYTHDWFYNKYLKCKRIDKHKLMIANYNGKEPSCDYCIWQFTETGRLKGIKSHHVDLSRFNKNYTIADILLVND